MTTDTAPPTVPSTPEPGATATDLLDLMMRLGELLAHETELVRSGHVRDIEPLQREKLRLFDGYRKALKELGATGLKISALPLPLRTQILAASEMLAQRVSENERALRVGREATRRLIDVVVTAIQSQQKPLTRYNAHLKPMQHAPLLTLALDRRL